jgi:CRISPR type III-B/RAMP module-associated protein Cmr5
MTMERKIAGKARVLVGEQRETTPKHEKESAYRSLCESFPILLRSAGLAQTASYLRSKRQDEYASLYSHLEEQLRSLGFLGDKPLGERAADPDMRQSEYRLLTEIAMQAALWHKRLAQALLRKKGEQ